MTTPGDVLLALHACDDVLLAQLYKAPDDLLLAQSCKAPDDVLLARRRLWSVWVLTSAGALNKSRLRSLVHSGSCRESRGVRFGSPSDSLLLMLCMYTQGVTKPYATHPAPHTLHPTPYTLNPTPYTLHPTPHTLHPTPCTLHPTPYTLHPTPYTLNARNPCTREGKASGRLQRRTCGTNARPNPQPSTFSPQPSTLSPEP